METITVSKEEAKKMIDDMPGDEFTFVRINIKTHIHSKPKRKNKEFGKDLIDTSKKVDYQDNDFFGVLSLYGSCKYDEDIIHNILFPQLE